MSRRHVTEFSSTFLVVLLLAFAMGCGSSSSSSHQSQPPVFTSSPVTAATQGDAYSYQLAAVDPAGGSVTFALTTSPSGATLATNTISWTPTAAESRVSNNFEVTATTSSGGSATQSWTVTPGGTITVNWMNTYWGPNGAVQVPALPSAATTLSALWTNADGSISVQKSFATSSGVFSIPNVPGGNYWMQIGSSDFWTNTSTFDAGQNYAGPQAPTTSGINDTDFTFNLSGLDSVPEMSGVNFAVPVYGAPPLFYLIDNSNSTSLTESIGVGSDIDWSQIDTAFFTQLVPSPLGTLNNLVAASSLIATNLSLVDGQTNTITETLQPAPQTSV